MPVTAVAELELSEPAEALFARLIDYRTWTHWMPASFRPVRGPERALRLGDRVLVRMAPGLPTTLRVIRLEPGREICWRGGVPGLILGEHAFFFDDLGDGRTRIRSVEPFTGLLTSLGPIGTAIERAGAQAGRQMLEGFRDYVARDRNAAAG